MRPCFSPGREVQRVLTAWTHLLQKLEPVQTSWVFGHALRRFNPDGSTDFTLSFSPQLALALDGAAGLGLLADGRLVAVGPKGNGVALVRTNANGQPDTSFGINGVVTYTSGFVVLKTARAATYLSDDRLLVTGESDAPFPPGFGLARFLPNGNRDATFGQGGRATIAEFGGTDERPTRVLVQPDGRIILIGNTSLQPSNRVHFALARYNPNGSLDASFGTGGKVTTDFAGAAANGGALQTDGKLVVVGGGPAPGAVRRDFVVARYLGDDRLADVNLRFLSQVYFELLRRPLDPVGQASFLAHLHQGGSRSLVVQAITVSAEYRTLTVQQLYGQVFGRDVEPAGLTTWVGFLNQGGTTDQLHALLLGSDEYFRRAGATAGGFLNALYRDTLGRAPDPVALREFSPMVNARIPLTAVVAAAVLRSPESDRHEVQELYRRYLRRNADSAGHDTFTALLQRGVANEVVLAALVGSEEYFSRV